MTLKTRSSAASIPRYRDTLPAQIPIPAERSDVTEVCGNRRYHFTPDQPEFIKLTAANLSDTPILQPQVHIWVIQKQGWFQIPEGIPPFNKQP